MTIKEIKNLLPIAIARFKERIPQSATWIDKVVIKVASRSTAERLFQSTIAEYNEYDKPFITQTKGEVFIGKNGYAIIIYQYRIKNENDLMRVVWHELGHICSNIANKELEREGHRGAREYKDTPLVSGYAVWSEFIAEVIANYVANEQPTPNIAYWSLCERLEYQMAMAFDDGYWIPAELGHYYANLLTDIDTNMMVNYYGQQNLQPPIGLDRFCDGIADAIKNISRALDEHLYDNGYYGTNEFYSAPSEQGVFWKISRGELENIGTLFDELYELCRNERLGIEDEDELFEVLKSRLLGSIETNE